MKKTFWTLFFIVLISANLLVYMISLDGKDVNEEKEVPVEGYTGGNVDSLLDIYYIIFAGFILLAIVFIILTLVRQNAQVYY